MPEFALLNVWNLLQYPSLEDSTMKEKEKRQRGMT